MAMEILNQSSYVSQSLAGNAGANNARKTETKEASERAGRNSSKSTAGYRNELAKLVPSVKFRVGNACVSDQSGKSLTVNPKLLEKMQNDPKMEKDMKDMIKGVESMSKLAESIAKASGWTIVYQHSYIDENGKYHCRMQTRNDGMLKLSDKLREERRKNSEKLIEKSKEKAAEKKEELEEKLEENSDYERMKEILDEKMAASKDGKIYLNESDYKKVMETAREDGGVKISISQEGMKYYRDQVREIGRNGAFGKVVAKGDKDSLIKQAKEAAKELTANRYDREKDTKIKEMITEEFRRLHSKAGKE